MMYCCDVLWIAYICILISPLYFKLENIVFDKSQIDIESVQWLKSSVIHLSCS